MLKRLKEFFDKPPASDASPIVDNGVKLASAALLAHAARLDGHFDDSERTALQKILTRGFDLTPAETTELIALAEAEDANANDLYRWTSQINKNLEEAEKIDLMEQLWTIVLADGVIDDYETHLIRRVTGLIHVPDRQAGAARKRAETALKG